jgi:sugar (pentulose or hexulose) kinase
MARERFVLGIDNGGTIISLTSEAWSEATNISGSGLMNVRDASIDRDLLVALSIGEAADMIPPLRYSAEHCGAVTVEAAALTGLAPGTPVAGGMFDIDSCAIAMSITRPEQLCTITGTWSINEFIAKAPITGTCVAMNSLYAIPGFYLLEELSATSAENLEWVIQNCFQTLKNWVLWAVEWPPLSRRAYIRITTKRRRQWCGFPLRFFRTPKTASCAVPSTKTIRQFAKPWTRCGTASRCEFGCVPL